MNSDRIDELIALAALGELSESDRRELDVAAQGDPIVAADLDAALATAAAIQRPHAEQPPTALRNSVLSAITATPQEDVTAAPVTAPPVSLDSERRRRGIRPAILAAAAAVALFVAGGVVLIAQNGDPSDPIAAVVDAPDASSRQLAGEIQTLTAVYSPSEGALVIQGESVPVLDDTETYQLWLVGDDGATSVGTFRPDEDGTVAERFADADPSGFVIGVTEEPAGGSESPTLPILASA
ncbi:MAG: anti-sigma factor [Rhodococcus sp. (in: high G+C Gram-positive bacteria)]